MSPPSNLLSDEVEAYNVESTGLAGATTVCAVDTGEGDVDEEVSQLCQSC